MLMMASRLLHQRRVGRVEFHAFHVGLRRPAGAGTAALPSRRPAGAAPWPPRRAPTRKTAPRRARAPAPRRRAGRSGCAPGAAARPPRRDRTARARTPARNRRCSSQPRSPPCSPLGQLDHLRAASAKPSAAWPSWQRTSRKMGSARLRKRHHIHARRHRKQDVPHPHAFAGAVGAFVRGMVAAARFFRRFGHVQLLLQQRVDGAGRRFADHAVGGGRVVRVQQAGALRGLAQQLGAGALAQILRARGFRRTHAAPRR